MNINQIEIVPIERSLKDFGYYKADKNVFELEYTKNLPVDYLNLVERFGEGIFADYIRIFPPARAWKLTEIWRKIEHQGETDFQRFGKKEFDNPLKVVDELILIGDTLEGDEIFYWKDNYYVLQIQVVPFIKKLGSKILDVFEYYESDEGWEAIEIKKFTPYNSELVTMSLGYILNCNIQ